MKKKWIFAILIVLLLSLLIIFKPWGSKPFKDLSANEIISVSVELMPPNKMLDLNESDITELVEILRTVVIYNKVAKISLAGQSVIYTITKSDGTILKILPMGDLMQIGFDVTNGTRFKAKYESSEELNSFANRLLADK